MYLEELIISNYKSCQFIDLKLSENIPNVFIGLNDSGKSTILSSLDLLLGDKPKYYYLDEGNNKKDLSNSILSLDNFNELLKNKDLPFLDINEYSTTILGKLIYDDLESKSFSELSLTNPLMWSIESNEDNVFWIVKNFYNNIVKTFILTKESVENELLLWNCSQTELNRYIKDFEITTEEIENENKKGRFTNLEKIRAIYAKKDCIKTWTEYKMGKNDKDIFPIFSLFDWHTSLDEIVNTAKTIMQEEIQEYLNPLKTKALEDAVKVENAINKKFGELCSTIQEVAKDIEGISSKVFFDVKEQISDVMVTKSHSDGPIHLENQGEGLKRQIWFSLIKAKASIEEDSCNKYIWAFDEPETHLYPGAQRDFFDILNKISIGDVQTLISTHSTIFTDKSNLNKINSVKQQNGYTEINFCDDIESIYSTLNIKNSDFLFYNKFLVVEGDTEHYLIPELYKLYSGNTLISDNIQLINAQGKNNWNQNKQIIDKVLGDFKKSDDLIVYLFDNDMSYEIGSKAITEYMFFVGDQDIEDSIDSEIWVSLVNSFFDGKLEVDKPFITQLKSEIPIGSNANKNQKFFKLLNSSLLTKWVDKDYEKDEFIPLPSKGKELADFILMELNSPDLIPQVIKDAFDILKG